MNNKQDKSKLEALNKIEVADFSISGDECEYVAADKTDENIKTLEDGGFLPSEINEACEDLDSIELSYLAFNYTSACCWSLQDGFF